MATTTEAISAIAKSLGLTELWVLQIAKALRAESHELWPIGARGGGKNAAHIEAHHLRNLTIGCLVANRIPNIARRVREYAALEGKPSPSNALRVPPGAKEGLQTLGAAIDYLIEAYTRPTIAAEWHVRAPKIEISRTCLAASIETIPEPKSYFRQAFRPKGQQTFELPAMHVTAEVDVNAFFPLLAHMVLDSRWGLGRGNAGENSS